MEKNAVIIYERYYDTDNKRVISGGVQTYISNLIPLLIEFGYKCVVHQCGISNTRLELDNCTVIIYKNTIVSGRYDTHTVLQHALKRFDKHNDLLIFADHILTEKNEAEHSISIQHGIHWDIPNESHRSRLRGCLSRALFSYREQKRVNFVKRIVCVDYNFLNWYRTQVDNTNTVFTVIPNFAQIAPVFEKPNNGVRIIFARRFVKHRGTRVFAAAATKILNEYNNVSITIAGRGPDEDFLRNAFINFNERVSFIQYSADDSLSIHSDKHIAVVPTIGSEGTSLSLLEAMSSQCAVICTNVGGMTNIVLNGFNGLMVDSGNAIQLYNSIKELIDNPRKRQEIAQFGYLTVNKAFSHLNWIENWKTVISGI